LVANYALKCLTNCESIHREVAARSQREVIGDNYFRLNVCEQAMSAIGLADWDKFSELKSLTIQHMDHPEHRKRSRKMARLLLNRESATDSSVFPHLIAFKFKLIRPDTVTPKSLLPMFHISYRRNRRFTGREDILSTIFRSFTGLSMREDSNIEEIATHVQ
jgi:hypothetical protein